MDLALAIGAMFVVVLFCCMAGRVVFTADDYSDRLNEIAKRVDRRMRKEDKIELCEALYHKVNKPLRVVGDDTDVENSVALSVCDECRRVQSSTNDLRHCPICEITICMDCKSERERPSCLHLLTCNLTYGYNFVPHWRSVENQLPCADVELAGLPEDLPVQHISPEKVQSKVVSPGKWHLFQHIISPSRAQRVYPSKDDDDESMNDHHDNCNVYDSDNNEQKDTEGVQRKPSIEAWRNSSRSLATYASSGYTSGYTSGGSCGAHGSMRGTSRRPVLANGAVATATNASERSIEVAASNRDGSYNGLFSW